MDKPIKVLIVEDSAVIRDFLVYIISSEPDMHVVGTAKNGQEAVKLATLKKPDIITMDIEMPIMNGFEATEQIMSTRAVPIIIVTSSYSQSEVEKTFQAIDAGAMAILAKPSGVQNKNYQKNRTELINTIRTMSEVKVVTRHKKYLRRDTPVNFKQEKNVFDENTKYKIAAIGVSTGGPQVLNTILSLLPSDLKIPIVIVQHIPSGFLEGMVEWLNEKSKLPIKIAKNDEELEAGKVYFCPAELNMGVTKNMKVELKEDVPDPVRPSVSYLFRSIGKNFQDKGIGILLTGMGKDGSEELAIMKEKGALTIVQDQESSIVYGMPGEAVLLNAHRYILSPEMIAKKLSEINANI